jgi:hypothetical protein
VFWARGSAAVQRMASQTHRIGRIGISDPPINVSSPSPPAFCSRLAGRHIQGYPCNDSTRRASVGAAGVPPASALAASRSRARDLGRIAAGQMLCWPVTPVFKTVSALMDVQPLASPRGLPHPSAGARCRRAPGWDGTTRGGFPGSGGGRDTMQKTCMRWPGCGR